jgi:hypothetical protein
MLPRVGFFPLLFLSSSFRLSSLLFLLSSSSSSSSCSPFSLFPLFFSHSSSLSSSLLLFLLLLFLLSLFLSFLIFLNSLTRNLSPFSLVQQPAFNFATGWNYYCILCKWSTSSANPNPGSYGLLLGVPSSLDPPPSSWVSWDTSSGSSLLPLLHSSANGFIFKYRTTQHKSLRSNSSSAPSPQMSRTHTLIVEDPTPLSFGKSNSTATEGFFVGSLRDIKIYLPSPTSSLSPSVGANVTASGSVSSSVPPPSPPPPPPPTSSGPLLDNTEDIEFLEDLFTADLSGLEVRPLLLLLSFFFFFVSCSPSHPYRPFLFFSFLFR